MLKIGNAAWPILNRFESQRPAAANRLDKMPAIGATPRHWTIVLDFQALRIIPWMKNRSHTAVEKLDPKPVTVSPPTVAVSAITVIPEYIRLPKPGENDPLFGLSRSYLNLLILPSKQNHFQTPVRSSALRQGNSKTGVRLINVASLKAHLDEQTQAANAQPSDGSSASPISPAEFIRLPKIKERDPLFGLSRSFLNELILPCPANGYKPPVQSHVLRRRGYRNGIRLISVDSLRQYVKEHEEPAAGCQNPGAPRIEQGDI